MVVAVLVLLSLVPLLLLLPSVQAHLLPTPETLSALVQESKSKPPAPGVVHGDLVYKAGWRRRYLLDLYEPLVPVYGGKAPLVVFFHGGSWIQGDKVTIRVIDRFLIRMRQAGYFVAAVNYTTTILRGLEGPLSNGVAAVRWLIGEAGHCGYSSKKIGLYGVSAGGHIALMAASRLAVGGDTADPLAFVFAECAPTDLVALKEGDAFEHSKNLAILPDAYLRRFSPVEQIDSSLPPVLLYHAEDDRTVSVAQSESYAEALLSGGGEARLIRYPEGGHAFLDLDDETWYQQESLALAFFQEVFGRGTAG